MKTARWIFPDLILLTVAAAAITASAQTVELTAPADAAAQPAQTGKTPDTLPERLTIIPNIQADGVYRPVELGAHHRRMQKITEIQGDDGFLATVTNSYVELGTAMHVWSEAERKWIEASDEIEIDKDGAFARKSQHQVSFAANLNDPLGAIDMRTPDGKRMRSRVVGLAYTEADTGKSVFIAEVKDSPGVVLGRNQVLYIDAFDEVKADVRYTTTRSSFEQDVIVREKLPSPETFGLKSETTKLEVWTEFLEAPEPDKRVLTLKRRDGTEDTDESLDFGGMQIGPGKAFTLGNDAPAAGAPSPELDRSIPVSKSYGAIDGRVFLIEAVPYAEARPELDALPESQAARKVPTNFKSIASVEKGQRARPVSLAQARTTVGQERKWQIVKAANLPARKGFLLDYVSLNSSLTNYIFKGDTTYYVTGPATLFGTTSIEGGACIKYDRDNYPTNRVWLWSNGPVQCKTSAYRPAILTAKDDDTVGETVSGSSGSPTGYYAKYNLITYYTGASITLEYLQSRFALVALSALYQDLKIRHCQVVKSQYGMIGDHGNLTIENCLIDQTTFTALCGLQSSLAAAHMTIRDANQVFYDYGGGGTASLMLTNSLIAGVTNLANNFTNTSLATFTASSGLFQLVGAGNNYLAANSPYRNAGTTTINTQLLADLKKKTTYPPVFLTNNITANTTLSPTVQRDTDSPDLGYHYDPLDWLVSGVTVSNATLLLTNGVALGSYGSRGFYLGTGGKLVSEGTPTNPNRLGHLRRVQEQPNSSWSSTNQAWLGMSGGGVELRLRHSDLSVFGLAADRALVADTPSAYTPVTVDISDSYLRGIYVEFVTPFVDGWSVTMRNNLCEGVYIYQSQNTGSYRPYILNQWNNTFLSGWIFYSYTINTRPWAVQDNLFLHDTFYPLGNSFGASNNGYRSGFATLPGETNAKTNLVADYQSGPMSNHLGYLGNYYYPTSGTNLATLINAGSRTASAAGLYHHTTQTNQTKEAGTTVDIGFHCVALNGSNQPNDADSDGLPDYLEDRNGDGSVNSGETNWQDAWDAGFKILITEPKSSSNVP